MAKIASTASTGYSTFFRLLTRFVDSLELNLEGKYLFINGTCGKNSLHSIHRLQNIIQHTYQICGFFGAQFRGRIEMQKGIYVCIRKLYIMLFILITLLLYYTYIYIYMSIYSNLTQNLAPETPQNQDIIINSTCG